MCGIAGVFAFDKNPARVTPERLGAMAAVLAHRGPDGDGFFVDPQHHVGLAHRRLSIIDLCGGGQPIANEDGSIQVIFNGEIFNYVELRDDLRARGHVFRTATDTEVLVHLYEDADTDFVHALNGQFAIALWDARRRRLLLARDRPGILPLYYRQTECEVSFGSEIKAILAGCQPGDRPAMHADSLRDVLTTWAPISPSTMFEGVFEVEPGQLVLIDERGLTRRRYWTWQLAHPDEARTGRADDLADELLHLLDDATRLRLRADVPVGAYLSGGLDSSVLTALASRRAGAGLRTFSIGFDDPALDEGPYQRVMADAIGGTHSTICCTRADVAAGLADVVTATETPITRAAPVPMSRLAGHVRSAGIKVVLTGEGADEVLGGYDLFKETKIRAFCLRDRSSPSRARLLKRLYPYLDFTRLQPAALLERYFGALDTSLDDPAFSHRPRWNTGGFADTFLSRAFRDRCSPESPAERVLARLGSSLEGLDVFGRAQVLEARLLMAGYLLSSQGDRMLMRHSVEGRFPYLDHRVIEFGNRLEPRLKMRVLDEKFLLKRAARSLVPAAILRRPKQPYRAPDAVAFFGASRPAAIDAVLDPANLHASGCFDPDKVARLSQKIARAVEARQPVSHRESAAWMGIVSTLVWQRQFQQG